MTESSPTSEPSPDAAHDELRAEIAGLRQEAEALKDKWLRGKAEADNVRRRAQLDIQEARAYGAAPFLEAMLPVLDNLERALALAPPGTDPSFLEGLRLIAEQWLAALAAQGVQRLTAPPGTPLDPARHRVVFEQETDDVEPGRITLQILPGYALHDRLLREVQVATARPTRPAAD